MGGVCCKGEELRALARLHELDEDEIARLHVTIYKATFDGSSQYDTSWCVCKVKHAIPQKRHVFHRTKSQARQGSSHEWCHTSTFRWHAGDCLHFELHGSTGRNSCLISEVTLTPDQFWPGGLDGDLQLNGPKSQAVLTVKIQVRRVPSHHVHDLTGHYFDEEEDKHIHITHVRGNIKDLDICYGHRQLSAAFVEGVLSCTTMDSFGNPRHRKGRVRGLGEIVFDDGSVWRHHKGLRKVLHVHGLASSALQARKINGTEWFLIFLDFAGLLSDRQHYLDMLKLRIEECVLPDQSKGFCVADWDNYEVRAASSLAGIISLNHGRLGGLSNVIPEILVWKGMVDSLKGCYHQISLNYDWRKFGCPRFSNIVVDKFRIEAENAVNEGVGAIDVLAHSMGACVTLYCLSRLGEDWQKRYIDQVILIAPALMGSPCMVPSWANNPLHASKTAVHIPDMLSTETMTGETSASWVSFPFLFPSLVGGINTYPSKYPIIVTPKREYTVEQMGELLIDISAQVPKREMGAKFLPSITDIHSQLHPPAVPTHLIYTAGQDTPAQMTYASDDLGDAPEVTEYKPGDGTLLAENMVQLGLEWSKLGAEVAVIKALGNTDHSSLVACEFCVKEVHKILAMTSA